MDAKQQTPLLAQSDVPVRITVPGHGELLDTDHDKRSWRCSALVAAFVVLSLALNASSREQAALVREVFNDTNDAALLLFITSTAAAQLAVLAVTIQPLTSRGDLPNKEALAVITVSHAGATFLHDFLTSFGNPETSLTAAFAMPVLTLLALWIVTSVMPRFNTWSSIAIISIGCTFMSLRMRSVMTSDRTSLISALCAFSFVLRNIVVRQLVAAENVSVKPRGSVVIAGVASSCVVIVTAVHFLGSSLWVPPVMCAVLTCGLSVGVFYVSTQLLKSFGVVFVSLFQIWVVLLEALMLTSAKHRPDLVLFATAVILVLLGHYLFFKDHVDNGGASSGSSSFTFSAKPVNIHEQYTRIEFLLFFCSVLGVIFYVFQPKVSQRDLNTLSYVGLDRVIRRLLSIQDDPAVQ